MKVTVEGLTLERRDGLIAIEGISEVLVRGNEVLLLPVGAEYAPQDGGVETCEAAGDIEEGDAVVLDGDGEPELDPVEEDPDIDEDPPKKPAAKRGRPKAVKAAEPEKEQTLDPTRGKGNAARQTLAAIRELGGGTAKMVADRMGISEQAVFPRLTKLKIDELIIATGTRPKRWKLTGKGLDALED